MEIPVNLKYRVKGKPTQFKFNGPLSKILDFKKLVIAPESQDESTDFKRFISDNFGDLIIRVEGNHPVFFYYAPANEDARIKEQGLFGQL